MGKQFSALTEQHIEFIAEQQIYFVATAAETGKVNLSPKGGDSLRVVGPNKIAWLNLTGSGNESAAHVLKNTRMTLMWCAFQGKPMILRSYGQAQVLHRQDQQWTAYAELFPESVAARQIFVLDIELVQSSCGMSVPFFDFQAQREELADWSVKQGTAGIEKYWLKKNQTSLDGFESEIAERSGLA